MDNSFLILHDSYELYEFSRQYYLDVDMKEAKNLRFPISVYFNETGKPSFKPMNTPPKQYKIQFQNGNDKFGFESDSIDEVVQFIRKRSGRLPQSGDIVMVKDAEKAITHNFEFFRDNFIDYELACKYDYGNPPNTLWKYEVIVVCGNILLIGNKKLLKCYLVEDTNIEYVED